MNAPYYMNDAFGYQIGLVVVLLVGFGFGFVLERAGFGNPKNLVSQFYVTEMRILKVMFTAVATCAAGLALLSAIGVVDISAINMPPSFLLPAAAGGLLIGIGMVVSGYCPGTCVVASGSGAKDGMVTFLGIIIGSVTFAVLFPGLEGFYRSTPMAGITLPSLLHLPFGVLAAAVLGVAIFAFLFGERLERIFCKKLGLAAPDDNPGTRNRVFAGLGVVAALALALLPLGKSNAAVGPPIGRTTLIGPVKLASALIADPQGNYVLDLRSKRDCHHKSVPGAICAAEHKDLSRLLSSMNKERTLHLVTANGVHQKQFARLAGLFGGETTVLKGGMAAFERRILKAPRLPGNPTTNQLAAYQMQLALHQHITGQKVATAPKIQVKQVTRKIKKGGGC